MCTCMYVCITLTQGYIRVCVCVCVCVCVRYWSEMVREINSTVFRLEASTHVGSNLAYMHTPNTIHEAAQSDEFKK